MVGRGKQEGVCQANEDSDGGDANFIVRGGQLADESSVGDEYAVKRLWAKWRINAVVFFLVEWEDCDELQWIPQKDISWQAIAEFEREYAESVGVHQSARDRRRTLKRERPTRTSRRIRGR
ncbi:Chromo domain-like [Phytophthora cactorum]|nr:Chromo domain-like [Phytophthora cactorum]